MVNSHHNSWKTRITYTYWKTLLIITNTTLYIQEFEFQYFKNINIIIEEYIYRKYLQLKLKTKLIYVLKAYLCV